MLRCLLLMGAARQYKETGWRHPTAYMLVCDYTYSTVSSTSWVGIIGKKWPAISKSTGGYIDQGAVGKSEAHQDPFLPQQQQQ